MKYSQFTATKTVHQNGIVVRRGNKPVMYARHAPFSFAPNAINGSFIGVLMGDTWYESGRVISGDEVNLYDELPHNLASFRFGNDETLMKMSKPKYPSGTIESYDLIDDNFFGRVVMDGSNDDLIIACDIGSIFNVHWNYGRLNRKGEEYFTLYSDYDEKGGRRIFGNDLTMLGELAQIKMLFDHDVTDKDGNVYPDIQEHLDMIRKIANAVNMETYTDSTFPITHEIWNRT
ncbi:hypothetical protein [Escherichia coli]|uniref:hypothetical protein n=1 Tax=Escherichia coli TaxID=562 RepID=UPI0022AD0335|nr:hypothetical protein [Escherichia coli]